MKALLPILLLLSSLAFGDVVVTRIKPCNGSQCYQTTVSCGGTQPIQTNLRVGGTGALGTVMFFTGGAGTAYWGDRSAYAQSAITDLRRKYKTVEIAWRPVGWTVGAQGQWEGQALLACRPATLAAWVRDNLYTSGAFCATGNSGGASQVAFMLTHYGLAQDLDAAILTGGPPMAEIADGCLVNGQDYSYNNRNRQRIDDGFGFYAGDGPCMTRNASASEIMDLAGHNTSGDQYGYPDTFVWLQFGEFDHGAGYGQGLAFYERIQNTPNLALSIIPGAEHVTHASASGANAVRDALLLECKR